MRYASTLTSFFLFPLLLVPHTTRAQHLAPHDAGVLIATPVVQEALRRIVEAEPATIEEQIAICQIAAPPFEEKARAEAFADRMRELGLGRVRIDAEGNAIGELEGARGAPVVVLAAHLDTVFPAGTDVTVEREGAVLRGPGISDDCRGLAIVLAVARALLDAHVPLQGTIVFVGTVGEEGRGNLRGARHLVDEEMAGRIDAFVGVDGGGLDLTRDAVGSRRYRVTFRGPGGHSYGDFGMPNPIHALGGAIDRIAKLEAPTEPKTTFNVGVVEGGISVNAIAREAAMEIDLRSLDPVILTDLDRRVHASIEAAVTEENQRAEDDTRLEVEWDEIGTRPAGRQPDSAAIVQAGVAAARALGFEPRLEAGSTDANAMIAAGIPAVTIDGGGKAGATHSDEEWFDSTDSYKGSQWTILYVLSLVGVGVPVAD